MRPIPSLAFLLLATAGFAGAQSQLPTLEERMSQTEFRAAGLDKLSAQELQQLNAWLQTHGGGAGRGGSHGGAAQFYPEDSDRQVVEAHIEGIFNGWRGGTMFTLDNGQQWQQVESGTHSEGKFVNPGVKIKPMMLGSWLMTVDGCGCSVRVQRVK
jgi:hypothetical protein